MSKKPNEPDPSRAESGARSVRVPPARPEEDELLHELQAHKIELEMQNEELRRAQISLEISREHYVEFYDFAPVGYLTLTDKGMISEINLTGATLVGMERSKLLHRRFDSFVTPENRDRWHRHFLAALARDDKLSCDLAIRRGDGSRFHARLDCLRLKKNGETPVLRIALTDITEHKQVEEAVHEQEAFFRMIAENIDDFIAVLDLEGRRLYNSPSYARLFGDTEKMKGTDSFAEIHPDDRERIRRIFMETVRTGAGLRTDFRFVLPDGSIRYMESCGGLIKNSQGQASHVVVVSRDITERKQIEEEIRSLAFYDTLTKLPNRRLLNDRLTQAMAASKRGGCYGALMFLDMDNFKPLNDHHGHDVGDLLLVEAARRINGCVREMDTVARFGGDEFVVILSGLKVDRTGSVAQAGIVAEKIRAILAEPYVLAVREEGDTVSTVEYRCTSSIGVALFLDHETRPENILKRADMAMYQAKNGGRNLICFYE